MGDTRRGVLFQIARNGDRHGHLLTVVEIEVGGSTENYIEVSEPGKCGCERRIALSELTHLLLNITDHELLTIPNRDHDIGAHAHG